MLTKKIFSFLLIVNILFAITQYFKANQQDQDSVSSGANPEKIIVLPAFAACIEWSGFSEQDIQSAETALGELNLHIPYKLILSTPHIKYQVHTSPFENRQTVEREINKLRNMGIISHRIQEQGSLLNAISFGEFEDKTAAHDMLQKLNNNGITNTTISEHKIEQKKFVFFEPGAQIITQLQHLITQFPNSRLVHTTCERL